MRQKDIKKGITIMSKNKSTLSQLGEMYIVYKLRWFILIGIIIFVSIIIIVKTNMEKK